MTVRNNKLLVKQIYLFADHLLTKQTTDGKLLDLLLAARGMEVEGITKFLLTPMGVLAPGSAHARPSAWPPIDMSGNFSAHMGLKSQLQKSSPSPKNSYPKFWNPKTTFNFFQICAFILF